MGILHRSPLLHQPDWISSIKVMAVFVLLFAAPLAWTGIAVERGREMLIGETPIRFVKMILVFGACLTACVVVPFLQASRWRYLFAATIAIGVALDQMMLAIFGRHYSLDLSLLAWVDRANAEVTLPEYARIIAQAVGFALCLGVIFALAPARRFAISSGYAVAFVATAYVASAGLLWGAKSTNYDLPAPIAWPALAVQTVVVAARDNLVLRSPVGGQTAAPLRRFRHIVFIVDESVRGDRLSLNNAAWDTTPFLAAAGPELVNFGVASSGTNCSGTSRMIMRTGLRPDQLPDVGGLVFSKPTVWQYAKQAGYKAIHVDPFRLVGNFHSGMNATEAKSIDEMISVSTLPLPDQDPAIAKLLPQLLARAEPSFIYINKNGVHPVFAKQYPPTLDYEPAGLETLPLDQAHRDVVRHYHRAVRWSVDGFFRDVWSAITAPDVLVLYTADHGLALFEGGHAATHCSVSQSAAGEGMVPLFAITGAPGVAQQLHRGRLVARDRASHFQVFPTLLWAMGYAPAWIEHAYGSGLIDTKMPAPRRFWTGALIAGGPSSWVEVGPTVVQVSDSVR